MNTYITRQWNDYYDRLPSSLRDIYFKEEYVRLYENDHDKAYCVICEEHDQFVIFPFLRRRIGQYYDFETAYGYGGPISNSESKKWIITALEEIEKCFRNERYICGFVRFHPLIENVDQSRDVIECIFDRKTIVVDLRESIDDIWEKQISSKNRNMIRKAQKNDLQFRVDYDFDFKEEFIRLYNNTMARLNAEEFYHFNDIYYDSFVQDFKGNSFIGTVICNEKIISSAIFMMNGSFGHYHLSGSDRDYSSLGANNFLLWSAAIELKQHDINWFHLGGGSNSNIDNSLYRFKRSFSPNEKDFYIGKWIFNQSIYDEICKEWEESNPELIPVYGNRLLKYRYTKKDDKKFESFVEKQR